MLTGRSLAAIFAWTDCLDFFKTAVQFDSVLCCRVTPKQKVGIFGIPEIGGNRALGAEGEQARDSGHRRWRERRQHAAAERLRRGDPRERGRAGESRGAVRRRLRARATSWCGSFDRWCDCCACTERGTGAGAGRSRGIRCTNRWCCAGARPCTRCSRCSPEPRCSARCISPSTRSSSSFSFFFYFAHSRSPSSDSSSNAFTPTRTFSPTRSSTPTPTAPRPSIRRPTPSGASSPFSRSRWRRA